METYTYLKGWQDNKQCSLKKFDFSNRTKKVEWRKYILWKKVHVLGKINVNERWILYLNVAYEQTHWPIIKLNIFLWNNKTKYCIVIKYLKIIQELWVLVNSTDKIFDGCIRDLIFNLRLHQKPRESISYRKLYRFD